MYLNFLLIVVSSSTKNFIGRYAMILVIFALYSLATISLGEFWAIIYHGFIREQNRYMIFTEFSSFTPMVIQEKMATGITSSISTFIADSSLVGNRRSFWYKIANHYNSYLSDLAMLGHVGPSMAYYYHSNTFHSFMHRYSVLNIAIIKY